MATAHEHAPRSASSGHSYEQYAPRSAAQRSRLARVEVLTNRYCDVSAPTLPVAKLSETTSNLANLFKHHSDDSLDKDEVGRLNQYARNLREMLINGAQMTERIDKSLQTSQNIRSRHDALVQHSGEISANCERLSQEVGVLTKHAEDIGAPLKNYDAVDRAGMKVGVLFKVLPNDNGKGKDRIVTVRGLAKLKVDDEEEYISVLNELDEACSYFSENSRDMDGTFGKEYGRRALILHDAALFLLKEAVVDRLRQTTSDVISALHLDKKTCILSADKLDASLVYTRFHGISSRSRSLISILQDRIYLSNMDESYRDLLALCQTTYCSCRESLLKSTVASHIESLRQEHGIVTMTRLASSFLERLCVVETALYHDFFGVANNKKVISKNIAGKKKNVSVLSDGELQKLLKSLCAILHRNVRRGLVQLADLDTLCQVVRVLREERSSILSSKSYTIATSHTMSGVIEDAQERLIYCAQSTLQKEVMKFKPSPGELDYPNKLISAAEKKGTADPVEAQMMVYETWYPPLKSVLRVLSKIFKVVDQKVFEDIALCSVQACAKCLRDAASHLAAKKGSLDSDLFLVKHLLILREQLSPFDIELRAVEKQLDFSEAGKAVTNFLANRNRHLFTMSNENALVMLLREGVSVQEEAIDSKRDLEEALRAACNNFIEHTSTRMAKEIFVWIESCKVAASNDVGTLGSQTIMGVDYVKKVVLKTKENIAEESGILRKQMILYLDNLATQGILFKPVLRKVSKALDDMKRFIAVDEDNGWSSSIKADVDSSLQDVQDMLNNCTF